MVSYFLNDSLLVQIPDLENNTIYLSQSKYLFSKNNFFIPVPNIEADTLEIEPQTNVRIQIDIVLKEYNINFDLTYIHKKESEIKTLKGTWKGVYYDRMKIETNNN